MGRGVVGLDIGHTGVRAVGVRGGNTPTVTGMGQASLPPGAVHEGEVLDPDAVADSLHRTWSRSKLSKNVVLGVGGRQVVVRQIDLPWAEEKAFRRALPYRVQAHLPMPVNEVVLDYVVLGESLVDGQRMVKVLLVAAVRAAVAKAAQAVERAGLRLQKVDLAGLAMLRAGIEEPLPDGVAEARLDVGAEVSTLVIHSGGSPRFARALAGEGGNKLTADLIERMGLGAPEAEELKRNLGTRASRGGYGRSAAAEASAAQQSIDRCVDGTIESVRGSMDYFLGHSPDITGLGRLVLSGGGSMLPGLAPRMENSLGIPVHVANPFSGLDVSWRGSVAEIDLTSLAPSFAVATGLAMAEVA